MIGEPFHASDRNRAFPKASLSGSCCSGPLSPPLGGCQQSELGSSGAGPQVADRQIPQISVGVLWGITLPSSGRVGHTGRKHNPPRSLPRVRHSVTDSRDNAFIINDILIRQFPLWLYFLVSFLDLDLSLNRFGV